MCKKKILLIGASGFVGTRLIDLLQNETILNIDKKPSLFFNDITRIGDIRYPEQIKNYFKNVDAVVLLAAEHRDDVQPVSLYYDVNVKGTKNVLDFMDGFGVKKIIFISSVAVYGLDKDSPDENHPADPFNHYGKSKWQAEEELREWYRHNSKEKSLTIIRPTVIFGERNRGNVFNLLKQIASGKFLMIGKGENKKSMAYVGNVAQFIKHQLDHIKEGYDVFNYIDKPDLSMNELVFEVEKSLHKKVPSIHFPYWLGRMIGFGFDVLSKLMKKKFSVSAVRIKKFCATTQFDAQKAHQNGFTAPFTLSEGLSNTLNYEFVEQSKDKIIIEDKLEEKNTLLLK